MSSKRNIRRKQCGKKIGYTEKWQVTQAIFALNRRVPSTKGTVHAYQCNFCGRWHVGHKFMRLWNEVS